MNNYFVSYTVLKDNLRGFGNTTIHSEQKFTNIEIINASAHVIEQENGFPDKSVVILNFQLMESE